MVGAVVADEFYERYRHLTQRELYHLLMAGSPAQVTDVAGAWRTAGDAMESVARQIRQDVARLLPTFRSAGAREFEYRINLVVAFADKLATEAAAIRNGLTVMAEALVETQRRVEPDRPDITEVGFGLGHVPAAEEQAKARERVSVLVARLAAEYRVTDHRVWPATIPAAPAGLIGETPMTMDPAVALETTTEEPADTALAGAGTFGGGAPVGVQAVSAPAAPVTLGGVAPGLAAAPGVVSNAATRSDGAARGGGTPMAGGMPMMAGAAGLHGAGRSADGYAVVDPRLGDQSWSAGDLISWHKDDDAPPSILDNRGLAAGPAQT